MKHHLKKIFQIGASIAIFTILIINTGKNTLPANASVIANVHGAIWSFMPTDSDECIKGGNVSQSVPCGTNTGDSSNLFSGQGLGWAFMNSLDDTSSTIPYGVSLDVTTGALSGYAWSSDEGSNPGDLPGGFWVDFAPAGPYPQFAGVKDGPARIEPNCYASANSTSCPLIGWIRYMPGQIADSSITGEWDGWVSLSGASKTPPYSYNVMYNKTDGTFTGDAWGDDVIGWVRFPRTISTVHVEPLQCKDTSMRVVVFRSYYPGQPVPPGCEVTVTDYCTNVPDTQLSLPWQDPVTLATYIQDPDGKPGICVQTAQVSDLCTNIAGNQESLPWQDTSTLIWYTQYPNSPIGYCQKVSPGACKDPSANNVGETLPCKYDGDDDDDIDPTVDLCQPPAANAPGDQLGTGPWQVGRVWYGLAGGMCKQSVCSNYPDAKHTDTFYATAPTGETELPDGTCGKPEDWCKNKNNPASCIQDPTGKLKPIYKEN